MSVICPDCLGKKSPMAVRCIKCSSKKRFGRPSERNLEILLLRRSGETLEQIGEKHNLSRSRVGKIVDMVERKLRWGSWSRI